MFSKTGLVGILKPRKRCIVLIGTLGTIVVIAIIIATIGTIYAVTPNTVSWTSPSRTSSKQTTPIPRQQTQIDIDCKEPSINVTKEDILVYFKNISTHKTMTGLMVYTSVDIRYEGLEIIKRVSGKTPAVLSITMPDYHDRGEVWMAYIQKIISYWKKGHFMKILWDTAQNPMASMALLNTRNESNWNDLITDGGKLNQVWKKALNFLANYLKRLQLEGVVPIFDILPFMNKKYALWNERPGKNGSVKMYQLTHDYLTKHHGLHSLIWAWSLRKYKGITNLYWPGDQYVDVAVVYMWSRKEGLSSSQYEHLLDVVRGKPIAMEGWFSIPTEELLSSQPRWTWFAIKEDLYVLDNVNAIFNNRNVINKENCSFPTPTT